MKEAWRFSQPSARGRECTFILRARGACLALQHCSKPRPVRRRAFWYTQTNCRCWCDVRLRAFQMLRASHAALPFSSSPDCFPLAQPQPEVACPRSSSSRTSSKRTQKPFRFHSLTRTEPDLAAICVPAGVATRLRECIFASVGKSETPPPNDVESGKVVVLGTS